MEFLKELAQFMMTRRKFWLVPLMIILILLSVIVVLSGSSALSPFIYSLF